MSTTKNALQFLAKYLSSDEYYDPSLVHKELPIFSKKHETNRNKTPVILSPVGHGAGQGCEIQTQRNEWMRGCLDKGCPTKALTRT